MARCWKCGGPVNPAVLCSACGAVQGPPRDADHFAVLGLEPHPAVDEARLADRYYELSRRLHPDRFAASDRRELAESVRATAALNAAYQALREIEARGRYWLVRSGEDLARDNASVPPALATTVFDVQEKLDELRKAAGDDRDRLLAEMESVGSDVADRVAYRRAQLGELLGSWPPDGAAAEPARARLKSLLSELSYLRTLERDVRHALDG